MRTTTYIHDGFIWQKWEHDKSMTRVSKAGSGGMSSVAPMAMTAEARTDRAIRPNKLRLLWRVQEPADGLN